MTQGHQMGGQSRRGIQIGSLHWTVSTSRSQGFHMTFSPRHAWLSEWTRKERLKLNSLLGECGINRCRTRQIRSQDEFRIWALFKPGRPGTSVFSEVKTDKVRVDTFYRKEHAEKKGTLATFWASTNRLLLNRRQSKASVAWRWIKQKPSTWIWVGTRMHPHAVLRLNKTHR